jgi:endo-1,4-beta-xylanase
MNESRRTVVRVTFFAAFLAAFCATSGFSQSPLTNANARIDQYRKTNATIRVIDDSGVPVRGATVKIEQLRHKFLFGCNAFPLLNDPEKDREAQYETRFVDLFNYATLGFYWGAYEPEPGKTNAQKLLDQAKWCKEHHIETKGHPLVWHEGWPKWAPSDPDEARTNLKGRVAGIVSRFAGLIDRWDVVNEAQVSERYDNGLGHWAKRDGAAAIVADATKWARAANKKSQLLYNDYKLDEGYIKLAQSFFERGAQVDAIGLQSHMHRSEMPLDQVWETCEKFYRLGKPLHFTEVTVLSGERGYEKPQPWPTTKEGEARQADYVEKLYTLLFSHPAVEAITWWDLMDGGWQGAPAGLVRADLSPKPVYERLMGLIHGKWWTREQIETGADGTSVFRGFAGHYKVTASTITSRGSVEADISKETNNLITIRLR